MPQSARLWFALATLTVLTACGGGNSGTSTSTPSPTPTPATTPPATGGGGGSTGGTSTPVTTPVTVPVQANQTSAGVNITVGAPQSSTTLNATMIALNTCTSSSGCQIELSGSDLILHAGSGTQHIILSGTGITGNEKVSIGPQAGPNDIQVLGSKDAGLTDPSTKKSVPGIAIDLSVPASASFGARTIYLQNTTNGDITAYAGGLEVQP